MPLLDHFHPPLYPRHHWESLHANWTTRLADALNERLLPSRFYAEEYRHGGIRLEIDVATYEEPLTPHGVGSNGSAVLTLAPTTWTPPAPPRTMPAVFPDTFEVRIYATEGGITLVGAIELVSPSNKDRPAERRAFAAKCASYLCQGVSLIVVDVVTSRRFNLHDELMRLMLADDDLDMPADWDLYAVAYRPVVRQDRPEIDIWPAQCAVGTPLPTLPLRLTGDTFVPVDFEAAYMEACRKRRLIE